MKINVLSLFADDVIIKTGFSIERRNPTDVPMHIDEIPSELQDKHKEALKGLQHIYTDFTCDNVDEDWIVSVDITKSRKFGLYYFRHKVRQYFESKENIIVSTGMIQDIIIYVKVKDEKQNVPNVTKYCQYTLRIQDKRVSNGFEMVVSYRGLAHVYNTPLSAMGNLNIKSLIGRVIINNHIYSYKNNYDYICNKINEAYPVISNELKRELKLEYDSQPRSPKKPRTGMNSNKYIRQNVLEDLFRKRYLMTDEFKSHVKLESDEFLTLDESIIHKLPTSANQLLVKDSYGRNVPIEEAVEYKMYGKTPYDKGNGDGRTIRYFFIYQDDSQGRKAYEFMRDTFQDGAFPQVSKKGYHYTDIASFTDAMKQFTEHDPSGDITFSCLDNAESEVRIYLEQRDIDTIHYRYIAIYISPISKESWQDSHYQYSYARIREQLLMKSVSMQGIYQSRIDDSEHLKYYFTNIYAAILAKVGGAPWVIPTANQDDLIIGIGAFRPTRIKKQYLGTAFRFDSNGRFHEFDCISGDDHRQLASKMRDALITFIKERGKVPKRVFIHFFKKMNKKEWNDFKNTLSRLGEDIPIVTATIYKSEESTMVAFDEKENDLMPHSGTYVRTGHSSFLLYNNVKYDTEKFQQKVKKSDDPSRLYHLPLKVEISCKNYKEEDKNTLIDSVITQCYQLSRMCWSSVEQQNLPITVKYPSLLAQQVPFFVNDSIPNPEFACSNLWFI
jgi:hypothetical protein